MAHFWIALFKTNPTMYHTCPFSPSNHSYPLIKLPAKLASLLLLLFSKKSLICLSRLLKKPNPIQNAYQSKDLFKTNPGRYIT
jgi:hypothetical protein